jgi:hypothetical protein
MTAPPPTPLPPNPFRDGLLYQALQKCLDLESLASTDSYLQNSKPSGLVAARLLGYLILHVQNATGRAKVADQVVAALDNENLVEVAQFYINHFIKACMSLCFPLCIALTLLTVKRASGPTPAPSDHPSRPSFEEERQIWMRENEPAKLDHRRAKQAASAFS